MTENDVLNPPETLDATAARSVAAQEVWLVLAREAASLALSWPAGGDTVDVPAGWRGLLLLDRLDLSVSSGRLRFQPLRLEALTKLLAFIDESRDAEQAPADAHWAMLALGEDEAWVDRRACEYWFLRQVLQPTEAFSALLSLLRRSESYWLVRFLLAQSVCGDKLQQLGERYGVSYSHFRRLCRNALGNAAKTELRGWRMARSLLDVVEGRDSLTQVALKHGYASSSHFSNEIKDLIGVSPRGLSNIIQLASK